MSYDFDIEDKPKKKAKKEKPEFDASDLDAAKRRAFEALSRRAYSYGELKKKLKDVGYDASTSEAACERVAELGYLDDIAFAKSFIEMKHASGWGKRKIIDALSRKYVSQNTIEDALADMEFEGFDREQQVEQALRLISKKPCETRKDRDRIVRNLISKGFSPDIAYSALTLRRESEETGD